MHECGQACACLRVYAFIHYVDIVRCGTVQALIGSNSETLQRLVDLLLHENENVLRSTADALSLIALEYVIYCDCKIVVKKAWR